MRILVTDSDTRSALAAVRALGRRGHDVITAGVREPSLASVSRYSSAFRRYPDPASNADEFVTAIVEIATREHIDVLLPMTEVTTLLTTEHQAKLPPQCCLPFPSSDIVAAASNKAHVISLANELGVPTPLSIAVNSAAEGISCSGKIPYPVVIKPAKSRVRVGSRWLSTGVSYAATPQALARALEELAPEVFPVLLQERIQGPGRGVFVCFDGASAVALFAHRRIREKPPSGGVSVLCESAALDPVAVDYATRLLQRLRWRGVAMVEFKQDQRDGSLRLMEINGRFWGSLQLSVDAGVDFPSIAVALASGQKLPEPSSYTIGVRSRWLAGDLDALLMTVFRSRKRLNLAPSFPGRIRSLAGFLIPGGSRMRYELERWDDPGPARLEWRRRLFGR